MYLANAVETQDVGGTNVEKLPYLGKDRGYNTAAFSMAVCGFVPIGATGLKLPCPCEEAKPTRQSPGMMFIPALLFDGWYREIATGLKTLAMTRRGEPDSNALRL